jgi:hypothetical protein
MGKSKWWMKPSYIYMRLKLFKVIQNYPKLYIEMHGAHEDHFIPMGFKEKVKFILGFPKNVELLCLSEKDLTRFKA